MDKPELKGKCRSKRELYKVLVSEGKAFIYYWRLYSHIRTLLPASCKRLHSAFPVTSSSQRWKQRGKHILINKHEKSPNISS